MPRAPFGMTFAAPAGSVRRRFPAALPRRVCAAALVLVLVAASGGCGQKGALYLPDDPAASEEEDER